jgi:hypothetical protein
MKVVPKTLIFAAGVAWFAVGALPVAAADAVLTHFEESAVVMPPGALTVRGLAEIRQFVEKGIAGAKANEITIALGSGDDVGASGDLG